MKDCKKKSKEELREEVKELSQEFENGLEKLFQSDEYIQFLSVMAKRPRYSLRNNLLIFLQNPDATFVSGYKTFLNNYGHQVQKGEPHILRGLSFFYEALWRLTLSFLDIII